MARNFANATDRIPFGATTFGSVSTGCHVFWLKSTQTGPSHILDNWNTSSRNGLGFILESTGKVSALAYDNTTARVNLQSTSAVNNGSWHHVAFNWNRAAAGSNALYIDGVSEATGNTGAAWQFLGAPYIGDPQDAFWTTYAGDIAEHAVYERNLTADEITTLSKGYSPRCVALDVLNMYCPFVRDEHNKLDGFIGTVVGTTVSSHPRIMGSIP